MSGSMVEKGAKAGLTTRTKAALGVLAVVVLVMAARYLHVQDLLRGLLVWTQELGPTGIVVFVVLYILACVLLLPGTVLSLGAGVLFGVMRGSVIVLAAATLGAACAFLAGRYLARRWAERQIETRPTFRAIDEAVGREGWKIVLLTRLSPAFPFNLLNYAYGITRVSFRDYVFASLIGMAPGTVMYVYLGSLAGNLAAIEAGPGRASGPQWALRIAGFLVAVVVTLYVTRVARRALQKRATPAGGGANGQKHVYTSVTAVSLEVVASASPGHRHETCRVVVNPPDRYNQELLHNVHPPEWVNPVPAPSYNLVVIGAGTAGLVAAAGAAGLGAKVALIEKHLLGGDCLNVGCVPSKCVIRSSRSYADIAAAGGFGVRTLDGTQIDFAAVMERMRRLRASISEHDSVWRFQSLGVDVFLGEGRFSGPDTVAIGGQTLRFKQAVLATGGRAVVPPVPGLAQAGFLTNETVFDLTERPARLACLGAGPIGCELAQAFRRLGCEVSLFHTGSHVLNKEDPEAAEIVQRVFEREGIRLFLDCQVTAVERANGVKVIHYRNGGGEAALEADEILVAVGRVPNVEGLGLEVAGVRYDRARGVEVNDRLQTTNPRIFAAGDVCMDWRFTHAADAAARIVIQNALFFGRKKLSRLTMPWCTYTDPEVAHVGIYPYEAERRGIPVDTFVRYLKEVDRALADGEEEGFVKVHVRKGTDRILGATLVARHAGEMVSEITLAMAANIGLTRLSGVIHPYPTQSEAIKQVGDLYNRTRLTPTIRKWFERYLACRR